MSRGSGSSWDEWISISLDSGERLRSESSLSDILNVAESTFGVMLRRLTVVTGTWVELLGLCFTGCAPPGCPKDD